MTHYSLELVIRVFIDSISTFIFPEINATSVQVNVSISAIYLFHFVFVESNFDNRANLSVESIGHVGTSIGEIV